MSFVGSYAHDQADHVIALDENSLSIGKLASIVGTPMEHAHTRMGDSFPPAGHGNGTLHMILVFLTTMHLYRLVLCV